MLIKKTEKNKINIETCITQLECLLEEYESELSQDKKIKLLEKAAVLSLSISQYFNDLDQPFNQVNDIKFTSVGVFETQIKFLESKS